MFTFTIFILSAIAIVHSIALPSAWNAIVRSRSTARAKELSLGALSRGRRGSGSRAASLTKKRDHDSFFKTLLLHWTSIANISTASFEEKKTQNKNKPKTIKQTPGKIQSSHIDSFIPAYPLHPLRHCNHPCHHTARFGGCIVHFLPECPLHWRRRTHRCHTQMDPQSLCTLFWRKDSYIQIIPEILKISR